MEGLKMVDGKEGQVKTVIRFLSYFGGLTVGIVVISLLVQRYGFATVVKEDGIIEWIEFLWCGLCGLFLFLAARRQTGYSKLFGVLWLLPMIAGIRELDGLFDRIFHGAWVVPAGIIASIALYRVFKSYNNFKVQALSFVRTQQMIFLSIGFFILCIFAQVSGKQAMWKAMLGQNYIRDAGRFMEEFCEFLGYIILVIGSLECYLSADSTVGISVEKANLDRRPEAIARKDSIPVRQEADEMNNEIYAGSR